MTYGSLKWAFKVMHDLDEDWTELFGPYHKKGCPTNRWQSFKHKWFPSWLKVLCPVKMTLTGRDEDPPLFGGLTDEQKERQKMHSVPKELLKSIWR